jgi:alcohol dehydrogenase (cytochrome c)/quinohemoprotein ethanol dehydrogenase
VNSSKLTSSLLLSLCLTALAAHSDSRDATDTGKAANVDDKRLLAAVDDGANWLSYGRTYDEQRFSPLTQINDTNVGKLGLQWWSDLETARGQEATPIIVDGVLYVSTAWSMVKAFDAATGKPLWSYDPQVPREKLVDVCCDAVNRGVAVYKGKVFVGTLAGHVVALDAGTGKVVWDTRSIPEGSHMAITGAPRVVKGKVLIGAAGSEYFSRGYLAAFDAETGKEAWRFYTVPGDPSKPFEGKHLATAAKTWSGEYWKRGGGGTVWDSITYDPETDLVYFGTANAEPWVPSIRNTTAGDNLYTASIVAIRPDSGEYVWHFQETPEDRWDFDSDQQIIAANIAVGGKTQRVVMHAPKNGFFYVLDAKTGKFISGTAFATVNWASGLDPVTGRPNVNPEAKYDVTGKPFTSLPSATGAHTWNPMSYSPKTGLVYIPTNEAAFTYAAADKDWKPGQVGHAARARGDAGAMPADIEVRESWKKKTTGALVAWDPVTQKARWSVKYPGPTNGGTLVTAGNLVFQGTAGGEFRAYAADTGKQTVEFSDADWRGRRAGHVFRGQHAVRRRARGLGGRLGLECRHPGGSVGSGPQRQPAAGVQARRCREIAGAHAAVAGGARPTARHGHARAVRRRVAFLWQQLQRLPRRRGGGRRSRPGSSPFGGAEQSAAVAADRARRNPEGNAAWSRGQRT